MSNFKIRNHRKDIFGRVAWVRECEWVDLSVKAITNFFEDAFD